MPTEPIAEICPRCSSPKIEPIDQILHADDEADVLSDSIAPPRAEPPNMRCTDCNQEWWRAPRSPDIDAGREGVAG